MKPLWSHSQIRSARTTALKPLLLRLGFRLSDSGADNFKVLDLPGNVVIKGHYWVRLHDGMAGNAIDFFVKLHGKSFSQTMHLLCSDSPPPSP